MIERQFIKQRMKEFEIQEYLGKNLQRVGHSHTKIQRTPLGDKVIIFASRPGLIIGRQGANIKILTKVLKNKFKLENPQIEINEVENIHLNAQIVAESIAGSLERFGPQRFKGVGHRVMADIMSAKALGVEILISGKIPGSRARRWRFYTGYLKKCGDIAITGVDVAYAAAQLKSGVVGIRVAIMPPTTKLPYHIEMIKEPKTEIEETDEKDEKLEEIKEEVENNLEKEKKAPKNTKKQSSKATRADKPETNKQNEAKKKPKAKK